MLVTRYCRTEYGCSYSVTVGHLDVREFNTSWPCSPIKPRTYHIEFADNGDLTDHDIPPKFDGPAAVALVADAQKFACDQLGLDHWRIRYSR